jgi:hypothetical protein
MTGCGSYNKCRGWRKKRKFVAGVQDQEEACDGWDRSDREARLYPWP